TREEKRQQRCVGPTQVARKSLVTSVDNTEARKAPALRALTPAQLHGSPMRPSEATILSCSSSLVPSSSPEPFFGTGGHHVCGAGRPSGLAGAEMPPGPWRRLPRPAAPLLARPLGAGAPAAGAIGAAQGL